MPSICDSEILIKRKAKFLVQIRACLLTAQNLCKSLNVIDQDTKLRLMKYFGNRIMKLIVVLIGHKFEDLRIMLEILHELLESD
jgi:hypothetical protein